MFHACIFKVCLLRIDLCLLNSGFKLALKTVPLSLLLIEPAFAISTGPGQRNLNLFCSFGVWIAKADSIISISTGFRGSGHGTWLNGI
jgi:hypothetical protein